MDNRYSAYLKALRTPFTKLTKLDFLQPDDSVAFTLDNTYKKGYNGKYDSRAFVQGGTLNVSLQNGRRRSATITLSNLDNAFDYSANKIWYGTRVRLSMGLVLPSGENFYLPQGEFYFSNPQRVHNPSSSQMTYTLVDKWAALDGTILGRYANSMTIKQGVHIFSAAANLLRLSRLDMENTTEDKTLMIDNKTPVFTDYYNDKPPTQQTIYLPDGSTTVREIRPTLTAWEVTTELGGAVADTLLELNDMIVGTIGYDQTGALRMESAQASLSDAEKPVLWTFLPTNSELCGLSEVSMESEVHNSILIVGQGLEDEFVWARVTNTDASSNSNVNLIGLRTYTEEKADYWNKDQCLSLARYYLKKKTILQNSISIHSSQMFHLVENGLVEVKRTDKEGAPIEKHLVNSFSIPLGESGEMTINATSVSDFKSILYDEEVSE